MTAPARLALRDFVDQRVDRLRSRLVEADAEAMLVTSPEHTYYLTASSRMPRCPGHSMRSVDRYSSKPTG